MEHNTAKNFILRLGSLVTLYLSVSFLIVLLFSIINVLYPDAAEGYWAIESATSSMRLSIAMLVVFFPTYLLLTRTVNELHRKSSDPVYLGITKWLIYFSLLVGGGILLGDLVAVIWTFLNGELTIRFGLKVLVLFVVIGFAFYYYLQDTKGFWIKNENGSKLYAIGASVVVLASVVFGFMNIETPTEVREVRLDQNQVEVLREIQWKIESYLLENDNVLPESLEVAYDEFDVPKAPDNREDYSYEITEKGFNLCATFGVDSKGNTDFRPYSDPSMPIKNAENWSYKSGRFCFERVTQ